jgi:hypothetical protein
MEPENSLPCSQEPATGTYPEPNKFNQQPVMLFKTNFNLILLSMPRSPRRSLSFRVSNQNLVCMSVLSHARYIPRQSDPRFYYPANTSGSEDFKLLNNFSKPPVTSALLGQNILVYPVLMYPQSR